MANMEPSKVLIVDDEPYVRQILTRFLTAEGYDCRTASSGEEALAALEAEEFHLVLLDIVLPKMSGIDLLNIIRHLYSDVAVLIVTGVDDKDTGILAVELGAYGYIIKPFERNEILIHVSSALERRRRAMLARESASGQVPARRPVALKRRPIKISTREIVDLIKSGISEAALMEKYNLSGNRSPGQWQERGVREP